MDAKIKKYARYLEVTAWILMAMEIFQWITKWGFDWIIYYLDCLGGSLGISKYKSVASAIEKLSSEQLANLKLVDAAIGADIGGSWIGLFNLAKLSWTSRLLGFLFEAIGIGILTIGFWFFIKLMGQFKKDSVFSIDVIELLNKLAKVIFWFALYVPINRAILSLIITFQNPPGQRLFMASITLFDVFIFAASWFFMILTSLMHESRQLKTDRDLTI